MVRDLPRQPKDLQGLLKFCLEATKSEDAPQDPDAQVAAMDPERKRWLEEAIEKMSVDVVEQLANGIKVLLDPEQEVEDQEEVLDRLEDWLGSMDMACNFHKIGGFPALRKCLESGHGSLRAGAAHLVGEVGRGAATAPPTPTYN